MSGFEVAGVVFGVLPMLISAAEHYDDVFKPFRRFKKCVTELEQYQQQLKTQKTIFLNQCQLLLSALTGRESAKAMLKEKGHPSWNDDALKMKLSDQLGSSREACEATVKLIAEKLKSIEEDADSFGSITQQSMPLCSIGDKAWRSRIQKKIKFSFSESRLDEYLDDLRKLNQDFRTLAKQTTRLDSQPKSSSLSHVAATYPTKKIDECRLVQRTSVQLYDAMRMACRHHSEHSAHFQLLPQNIGSTGFDDPFVRFNMAFTHGASGQGSTEPVWIAVESSFIGSTSKDGCETVVKTDGSLSLTRTITQRLESDTTPPCKKLKVQKSVRFVGATSSCGEKERKIQGLPSNKGTKSIGNQQTASSNKSLTTTSQHSSSLPDFCIQHDFCHQLRKSCGYSRSPENKYIGYFQKEGPCKHLVYFAAPVSVSNYTAPESLASIITEMSKRSEIDQFLEYERLRLAARLASAVLQFHATPLLRDFWQSEDVIFFGSGDRILNTNSDANSTSIASPHLNVQVSSADSKKMLERDPQNLDNTTKHLIRNPYLFSLGVTLIELAFQAPLRSLYKSEDLINGQSSILSDFFVASRLSKTISSSLGSTYGTVVRKCLECDFGQGTNDLKNSKLQAVFYQDVVCELERLERGFAMLQLGG